MELAAITQEVVKGGGTLVKPQAWALDTTTYKQTHVTPVFLGAIMQHPGYAGTTSPQGASRELEALGCVPLGDSSYSG